MYAGRKRKAFANIFAYILYFSITTIIGLVSRKIFLENLGSQLLGLTELLTSIISMLALVELGFGSAIYFSLYKPLTENNISEIQGIMQFYRKIYGIIGGMVFALGLFIIPFLPYIVDSNIDKAILYKVYLIFLVDSVFSYFLTYRRTIICADQKEYIATAADTITYLLTVGLQIWSVIFTKNIYVFLIIKVLMALIRNVFLYIYAGSKYFYIKDHKKVPLSESTKKELINNVKAIFLGNIGGYIITGTDNLYLSIFADLSAIYIYSNYKLIINMINGVFNQIFAYMKANIGNYIVLHSPKENYALFKKFFFANYILTQYTSISMFVLINLFMEFWIGKEYCWSLFIVFLILAKNYASMMNQALEAFRAAAGLFAPKKIYRYIALIEAGLNVFFSLFFLKYLNMGIAGIFAGTVVSNMISVCVVPFMTYKYLFQNSIRTYIKKYICYLLNTLLYGSICAVIVRGFDNFHIVIQVVLGILVCFIVPEMGNVIIYSRTEEFKYFRNLLKKSIRKTLKYE